MNMQAYWEMIARNKARTDAQDHLESFLKGVTNHYSKDVDVYMREAYADERLDIIRELREQG